MNNNDHLDKFISQIESIKMTLKEKNEMRDALASFAVSYKPVVSPYHHITLVFRRSLAIAFVAIISIGSLSNIASGQALPGQALYPVKIAHEEIKLATTLDTKKKISYEIRRTEKRIQEATELATQNDLDSEKQTEIAGEIKKQTTKVKQHIDEIKEKSPEDALVLNAELKSTIKINAEALKQVSTSIEKKKKTISEDTKDIPLEEVNKDQAPVEISLMKEVVSEDTNEDEYESIEVSFAEDLLESIDNEVKEIEAFEDAVSEELVQKENNKAIEKSEITLEEDTPHNDENLEEVDVETISEEIKSLEDILKLKEQIRVIKIDIPTEEKLEIMESFNSVKMYRDIDELIQERKYKKAFILLQEILSHYQEAVLKKEVHLDLGIEEPKKQEASGVKIESGVQQTTNASF